MKTLLISFFFLLSSFFFFTSAFAAQSKVENAKIVEISLRTLEYSTNIYADMALIKIDKSFTGSSESCNKNEVYLLANHDKAIYSAILAAKISDKPLDFYIDASLPKKSGWCKLVAVSIK